MAKYKLVVCRISVQDGSFMMSHPCASCSQLISAVGIRRVQYSVESQYADIEHSKLVCSNKYQRRLVETTLEPIVLTSCMFITDNIIRIDPMVHVSHGFRYLQSKQRRH